MRDRREAKSLPLSLFVSGRGGALEMIRTTKDNSSHIGGYLRYVGSHLV